MSNADITRLVVGSGSTIVLGTPVGQSLQRTDISNTLKWHNGVWESAGAGFWSNRGRTSSTIGLIASRKATPYWVKVGLAMAFLGLVGALLGVLYNSFAGTQNPALPMVPAGNAPGVIQLVDKPFVDAPTADPAQADASRLATAPLPIAAMGDVPPLPGTTATDAMAAGLNGSRPVVPESVLPSAPDPAPSQKGIPPAKPLPPEPKTGKNTEQDKTRPPAVMIFDDSPANKAGAATGDKKPDAGAESKSATAPQRPAEVQPTKADTSSPIAMGLVAIPPGGKTAVFTNPKTRLPEQFKVGDKLPNGDTVTSINATEGKVQTNRKEYNLD